MKTTFKAMVILSVLFAFVVPAMAADAVLPSQDGLQLSPEFQAWANDIAVRGGWLGIIILLDLVLGVTFALKEKRFEWQRLADFLSDYGPKVIGWLCLEILNLLPSDIAAMAGLVSALGIGAYAIIVISATGSVLSNSQALGILPISIPGVKDSRG